MKDRLNCLHLCMLLCLTALVKPTAQQTPASPRPAAGASFAKHLNRLYVYGGQVTFDLPPVALGQFFALDLSKLWKSASPTWIQLKEGPLMYDAGAVMSLDGRYFMTFADRFLEGAQRYDFEQKTWNKSANVFRSEVKSAFPVVLGTNGTVLIAGGSVSVMGARGAYDIYSFETDTATGGRMPPPGLTDTAYYPGQAYRAVWSDYLKRAVFYGGLGQYDSSRDVVKFYEPQSDQWTWN
ncbi:hypothetical protein BGZ73_009081, partial [Actinomortierella ambigua]